jgi:large subunit ribosomal protein L9
MKALLIKDVYKLGRAGDVKRVADGFGRNFLIPQGFAVLATPGALKQVEKIRKQAAEKRTLLNTEMGAVAEKLASLSIAFAAKAGETGKLYGSITTQDLVNAIKTKSGIEIKKQQVDMQPLRTLGEHKAHIRLTMDLVPDIKIQVFREGEAEPGTQPEGAPAPAKPDVEEKAAKAAAEA